MPGLFDLRVHPQEPGPSCENIASVTKAAAKGGFSAILAMPNTLPFSDNSGTIRFIMDRIEQEARIQVWLAGCLTLESRGLQLSPMGSLKEAGIIAVTDCPRSPQDSQIFVNAVHYAKMFDLRVIEFPRDMYLSKHGHANESPLSLKMGIGGYPRIAEEIAVQRAISVSKALQTPIHLSSISTKGSVELIRLAKQNNLKITADVSALHLLLNETCLQGYDTNAKMVPPLREETDREELVRGVCDGTVDAITSSHQPYPGHEKLVEFDKAPAGAIGLETATCSALEVLSKSVKDPYPIIAKCMSYAPRTILELEPPTISEGVLASLTIIDTKKPWTYLANAGESGASNSPLSGKEFPNSIAMTMSTGRVSYSSSKQAVNG